MSGRSVYGQVIARFSWMGSLPHFLTHGPNKQFCNQQKNKMCVAKPKENETSPFPLVYSITLKDTVYWLIKTIYRKEKP